MLFGNGDGVRNQGLGVRIAGGTGFIRLPTYQTLFQIHCKLGRLGILLVPDGNEVFAGVYSSDKFDVVAMSRSLQVPRQSFIHFNNLLKLQRIGKQVLHGDSSTADNVLHEMLATRREILQAMALRATKIITGELSMSDFPCRICACCSGTCQRHPIKFLASPIGN